MSTERVDKNTYFTIPECKFTSDDLIFLGWARSKTGAAVLFEGDSFKVDENTTLYAVWAPKNCIWEFNANNGTSDKFSVTKVNGTKYDIPACTYTWEGHTFKGWAESAEGAAVYLEGDKVTIDRHNTLYAIWRDNNDPYSLIDGIIPVNRGGIYMDNRRWVIIGESDNEWLLIAPENIGDYMYWEIIDNDTSFAILGTMWSSLLGPSLKSVWDFFEDYEKKSFVRVEKNNDVRYVLKAVGLSDFGLNPYFFIDQRVFLLSAPEALTYFSSDEDRKPGWWWTRSGQGQDRFVGVIDENGSLALTLGSNHTYVFENGVEMTKDPDAGIRPAFVFDRNSVLFTSAAAGGKSSFVAGSDFGKFLDGGNGDKKLTLLDGRRNGFSANINGVNSETTESGSTVDISYDGVCFEVNTYVSAMLCGSDGTVLGYASISPSSAAGTWSLALPSDLADGVYTLKVFCEQQNGDRKTDYASPMREIYLAIGNVATHSVNITPGTGMTRTSASGAAGQTGLFTAMTDVIYTADEGYYFPESYSVDDKNGISVTWNSFTQITVSGTPTADTEITLPGAVYKTKPDAPTTVSAANCTNSDNNDGKLTGITAAMEYKKANAGSWTAGNGSDITGLTPGTYFVRYKATDTTFESDDTELTVAAYTTTDPTYTPPKAKKLIYNGKTQELVDPGTVNGGTMYYALGDGSGATEAWSDEVPKAKNAGNYTVYYRIPETDAFNGVGPTPVNVSIARKAATVKAEDKSKKKGSEDPLFTATITGLVEGEEESLIRFLLYRDEGEETGTYVITPSGDKEQGNYTVTYETGMLTIEEKKEGEKKDGPDPEMKPDKVPFTDPGESYASSEDNFTAVTGSGEIKNQILDFSRVYESSVDPSGLKMTAISGSIYTTRAKLKDKNSAKASGGVKVKVNKKTLVPKIICKKSGSVTMTIEDDSTYTINFTVEKPKAQKTEKKMSTGGEPVTKTVTDLFGTHIDAGKLSIVKQKHSQAAVQDNKLIVNPAEKDSIKLLYKYLDRQYKMTMKVK